MISSIGFASLLFAAFVVSFVGCQRDVLAFFPLVCRSVKPKRLLPFQFICSNGNDDSSSFHLQQPEESSPVRCLLLLLDGMKFDAARFVPATAPLSSMNFLKGGGARRSLQYVKKGRSVRADASERPSSDLLVLKI